MVFSSLTFLCLFLPVVVGLHSLVKNGTARNAILLSPFDNEFVVEQDSTVVVIDSVNFIGPMLKK